MNHQLLINMKKICNYGIPQTYVGHSYFKAKCEQNSNTEVWKSLASLTDQQFEIFGVLPKHPTFCLLSCFDYLHFIH